MNLFQNAMTNDYQPGNVYARQKLARLAGVSCEKLQVDRLIDGFTVRSLSPLPFDSVWSKFTTRRAGAAFIVHLEPVSFRSSAHSLRRSRRTRAFREAARTCFPSLLSSISSNKTESSILGKEIFFERNSDVPRTLNVSRVT